MRGESPAETSSIIEGIGGLPLTEVEKAYLAGIIDGEGSIGLWRHHKNETATPNVSVANNSLKLLQWIKQRAGGTIVSKKKRKAHHNDLYAWSVRQDRAIRLLNDVKEFLIIKRKQAELITSEYKSVTHPAGKYTSQMLKKKQRLVDKIKKLNQR